MPPLVSVVMPVHNGERFLRAALDSVLTQSFREFEFIVVDDGSTDSTAGILAGVSDPRLRVLRIDHAGLVAALNAGVALATGRYLARMDADDVSYPDRLARQVEHLESHADTDVVTCVCTVLDDAGRVVGRTTGGVGDDMLLELAASNGIVHGSIMSRRASLPAPPIYTERPEDYRLWVALARAGRHFHCLDEPLYGFREHRDRFSLVAAESQSRGIVDVQWPLLEECSASRDLSDPGVRANLIRGWGTVGGAAYKSGQPSRGRDAYVRFRQLARGVRLETGIDAILHAAESLVWGGCPLGERLALRLFELRLRPTHAVSYRKLLLALPGVQSLRRWFRGAP